MSIEEVFNEARDDRYAGNLDSNRYEARVLYGVKICRDRASGKIELFDTSVNHDYYRKLPEETVKNFLEKGWRYGCYVVYLSNKRISLADVERYIISETNGLNRPYQIKSLYKRQKNLIH
jgi:hypothetical protein